MSRLSPEILNKAIADIIEYSTVTHKRKFLESIELQVGLRDYDPRKDKRFNASTILPFTPRPNLSVCLIADAYDLDRAAALKDSIHTTTLEELGLMNKDPKKVKCFAKKYDVFLASASVIRQIPRVLGPGLNKAGKFPTSIAKTEDLAKKVQELRSTLKFQLKKVPCQMVCVANVGMAPEEIRRNVVLSINFLVSLLMAKKGWQNIHTIYIKSTMGPAHRIV